MRKKALPSRLGPTLESRLSLDSRVSDRQRKALELGKQTAITVEVESGASGKRSGAAKGFITRPRRRCRKKDIRRSRSVIDCNFDRRTRTRERRNKKKPPILLATENSGERKESEPLSRRWRRRRRRRRRRRSQLMNDRRVSAVFGPLLIGSALQRRRKEVARTIPVVATVPKKASAVSITGIEGHRHIGVLRSSPPKTAFSKWRRSERAGSGAANGGPLSCES